jgi:hypothetical protein
LRIGEPSLEPPHEPNPLRLPPEHCSYEILCTHLFDEALGAREPQERMERAAVRSLLLGIYAVMGVREITLNPDEEERLR